MSRVSTGSGKYGKWLKKIPCMEKSWNLKSNEKSWNFGMKLLSGCQYHKQVCLMFRSLSNLKKEVSSSFFNRAMQNHLFLIIKQDFSC